MEHSDRSFNTFDLYLSDNPQAKSISSIKARKVVFKVLVAINIILNYDSGVIPASLTEIQSELSLSFTEKAALGSVTYLGLSAASLVVPSAFQKFSAVKTLIVMLSVNCAFCLMFSFSSNLTAMYLARLGMGFTQAFSVIYAPVWINEFSPKQKETRWMGLLQASVPVGVVLGYSVAALINLSQLATWRFAIQIQAMIELPLLILFAHLNKEDIDLFDSSYEGLQALNCKEQAKMLVNNKAYIFLVPALCCMFFVTAGIQYWVTLYLVNVLKISKGKAMATFIIASITAPICGVYTGATIGDLMGGYKGNNAVPALKFCNIAGFFAVLCTFPVALATTAFTEFVSLWLLLFFGGCIVPCASGISINLIQREYQANASSFAQLFYNMGGFFLAPILSARIMEKFEDYETGLLWGFRFILAIAWLGAFFLMLAYFFARRLFSNPILIN